MLAMLMGLPPIFRHSHIWLVVNLPLWKILVSWDYDIPNIWKNKICSKPPTRRCLFLQYHLRRVLKHVQDLTYLYNYVYNVHIIYIMLIALHSEYIIAFNMLYTMNTISLVSTCYTHSISCTFKGWWFQPLWKIFVSWDHYSQYMEK